MPFPPRCCVIRTSRTQRSPGTSATSVRRALRTGWPRTIRAAYAGDYEHDAVRRYANGRWETLVQDPRILWPDTFSVGTDGYLYFTANQLHRQPGFHGGKDERKLPYELLRVRIGAGPVLLK